MIDRLRTLYYKILYQYILRKAIFGRNTVIKCKLIILGSGKIHIGSNCLFESDPWGDDYVTLFTHRPDARIVIGNRVILRATRFGSHLEIFVGDDTVLENASIFDSDFHNIDATKRDENFNKGDRKVSIGQGSYVGCECLVSKGTILEQNVIMMPGSVIGTKKIQANGLLLGNPGRKVK